MRRRPAPSVRAFLALGGLLALVLALTRGAAYAEEALITNGDFQMWKGGLPTGWVAREGAHLGFADPKAKRNGFAPLEGGGVATTGDAKTLRWMLLGHPFPAKPGEHFEISYRARGVELRREGRQYDNCWVGAIFEDAAGTRIGFPMIDVRSATWNEGRLYVRAPARTSRAEVAFFCSLSGRLEVQKVGLRRVAPEESTDVLVRDMDRHYPFFQAHGIDWKALTARYRPALQAARTPSAFADALVPWLAALKDGHIWIEAPGHRRRAVYAPKVTPNFALPQILARLKSRRQVLRNVLAGRTKAGYGYLAIGSMEGSGPQLGQLDGAWRSLFDAPAIVLDLRADAGGREVWGQRLLGCLTDVPVAYARSKVRAGTDHGAFREQPVRVVAPRKDARYRGPVIALIGPGTVSSGEGMAMMLRALPQVTLIGQTTRGSSGNPQPLALPNGVTVWYSRWISMFPDGTPLERHGVEPDVRVEHVPGGDATFDKALAILQARLGKKPKR